MAQWSLRRTENADFSTDVSLEKGDGVINVEALDAQGNYCNFLNLKAIVVSPKGERVVVPVRQSGPGHYEARFPTKEPDVYAVNVVEMDGAKVVAQQTAGAKEEVASKDSSNRPPHEMTQKKLVPPKMVPPALKPHAAALALAAPVSPVCTVHFMDTPFPATPSRLSPQNTLRHRVPAQ